MAEDCGFLSQRLAAIGSRSTSLLAKRPVQRLQLCCFGDLRPPTIDLPKTRSGEFDEMSAASNDAVTAMASGLQLFTA